MIDSLYGNGDQKLGAVERRGDLLPAAAGAAKSKAKQVAHLAQLVARQCYRASSAEEQAKMAKLGGCGKDAIFRRSASQDKIGGVAGLEAQANTGKVTFQDLRCLHGRFAIMGEQKDIVGIAKVIDAGNAFDLPVQASQVDVREQAGNGRAEGYAESSLLRPSIFLVPETGALL